VTVLWNNLSENPPKAIFEREGNRNIFRSKYSHPADQLENLYNSVKYIETSSSRNFSIPESFLENKK